METFSETSWTDSVNFFQRSIADSLAVSENAHSEEEGNLYIDVVEESKRRINETTPPVQNGKMEKHERNNIIHESDSNDVKTKLKSNVSKGDDNRSILVNVVTVEEYKSGNIKSSNGEVAMDCVVESEILDSDDEDRGLVVNMELPDDMIAAGPLPATLAQLSTPKMTKPVSSLSRSATPLSNTLTTVGLSTEKIPIQPQGADSSHKLLTSQSLPETASRKATSSAAVAANPRSLPIHCVIEQPSTDVSSCPSNGCSNSQIVLDTYAILPGTTLFSELVKSSLLRVGYSPSDTVGATGGIQLKNWKTLMFEAVTDNIEATVEEILGEITSVATLKIHLSRQIKSNSNSDDIKDRLLQLLLTKSIDFLLQTGCPVEKSLLEAISKGEVNHIISEQVCTSFNEWYMRRKINNSPLTENCSYLTKSTKSPSIPSLVVSSEALVSSDLPAAPSLVIHPQPPSDMKLQPVATPKYSAPLSRLSPLNLDIKKEPPISKSENSTKMFTDSQESQHHNHFFQGHKDSEGPPRNKKSVDKTPEKKCMESELYTFSKSQNEGNIPSTLQNHHSNPYLGLIPGKTRIRTSFDPEQEIPRLQKWFSANQHPTREQMTRFMHELNGLESRKGRRPLDLTNIIYWFKNARAAQRRATRALDDSFENEENMDMNSVESGNSDSAPPFLPNKNAVYMIPFHPYPHLVSGAGPTASDRKSSTSGVDIDEPYDLSLSKRPSSEFSKFQNEKDKEENNFLSLSTSPSPTKSSSTSSECEGQVSVLKKKKSYCPPRFPALLDVASKMRQEIPLRSDDIYFNNISCSINNHNGCRRSPYRSESGSNDIEHSSKNEDIDNNFSNPSTPIENGDSGGDKFSSGLRIKREGDEYMSHQNSRKNYHNSRLEALDSGLELGQVKKEDDGKIDSSDDDDEDNTNDSYNSEEELKLRIKQNAAAAAVVDYASAMHNNVSRLTAANMAALSLAQIGQPLHIPQLTSSLAMAYYPMDPRFYSQPPVPHSLSTSPPTSLATTHTSHLSQLSLRQSQDCSVHIDSRSPLPSPSVMQQSLNQLNHHHHHHHQHHHQQQSPQQHHHRHNSEPRKRRTRVFIDPLTEIPKLEKWFTEDTHPSAFMIDKYCEELNKCEYRHKFPKLEPKNVQLWFKNHRAKVKRMKVSCDEQGVHNGTSGHEDEIDD